MEINFVELKTDEMLQINGGMTKIKDTHKYPCYIEGIYFTDPNTPHFTPQYVVKQVTDAFVSSL